MQDVNRPWFSQPSLIVMELSAGIPFDALIGMDIVRACNLFIEGPATRFTLDF